MKAKRKGRQNADAPGGAESAQGDGAPVQGLATAEELQLLTAGGDDEDKGFNLRGRKRALAKKGSADDGFRVDVQDPRLAKLFADADFDIDPTNPEFKKSEGMEQLLAAKRARRGNAKRGGASGTGVERPAVPISSAEAPSP